MTRAPRSRSRSFSADRTKGVSSDHHLTAGVGARPPRLFTEMLPRRLQRSFVLIRRLMTSRREAYPRAARQTTTIAGGNIAALQQRQRPWDVIRISVTGTCLGQAQRSFAPARRKKHSDRMRFCLRTTRQRQVGGPS